MSDFVTDFPEQIRIVNAKRLWIYHEKSSKNLTVFSRQIVKKKLAETLNTNNNGQIILNPLSDPLFNTFSFFSFFIVVSNVF